MRTSPMLARDSMRNSKMPISDAGLISDAPRVIFWICMPRQRSLAMIGLSSLVCSHAPHPLLIGAGGIHNGGSQIGFGFGKGWHEPGIRA